MLKCHFSKTDQSIKETQLSNVNHQPLQERMFLRQLAI